MTAPWWRVAPGGCAGRVRNRIAPTVWTLLALGGRPAGAQSDAEVAAGVAAAVTGAVVVYSALADIGRAPASARSHNRAAGLAVVPTFQPATHSVGLAVSVPLGWGVRSWRSAARKSPGAALGWSLASTLAPSAIGVATIAVAGGTEHAGFNALGAALITGGLVLGPAAGHWYAGEPGRASGGLITRSVTLLWVAR